MQLLASDSPGQFDLCDGKRGCAADGRDSSSLCFSRFMDFMTGAHRTDLPGDTNTGEDDSDDWRVAAKSSSLVCLLFPGWFERSGQMLQAKNMEQRQACTEIYARVSNRVLSKICFQRSVGLWSCALRLVRPERTAVLVSCQRGIKQQKIRL